MIRDLLNCELGLGGWGVGRGGWVVGTREERVRSSNGVGEEGQRQDQQKLGWAIWALRC